MKKNSHLVNVPQLFNHKLSVHAAQPSIRTDGNDIDFDTIRPSVPFEFVFRVGPSKPDENVGHLVLTGDTNDDQLWEILIKEHCVALQPVVYLTLVELVASARPNTTGFLAIPEIRTSMGSDPYSRTLMSRLNISVRKEVGIDLGQTSKCRCRVRPPIRIEVYPAVFDVPIDFDWEIFRDLYATCQAHARHVKQGVAQR